MNSLRLEHPTIRRLPGDISVVVDGDVVPACNGETIGAALAAMGVARMRDNRLGQPRGMLCGMGACFECLVTVNGRPGQRACLTPVEDGMRIDTHRIGASPPVHATASKVRNVDVAVVGAGPAGLIAARILAQHGLDVLVLDERPSPGGQFFKPLAASHAPIGAQDRQFADGLALTSETRAAGASFVDRATVWDARIVGPRHIEVTYARNGASHTIRAQQLVVATGAYERPWTVPGWTLPGAMTTGAAQTLARAYRVAAGHRILIAGNGPLNLQLAAEIIAGGGKVVAISEAARSPIGQSPFAIASMALDRPDLIRDGLSYLSTIRRAGTPLFYRSVLVEIEGRDRVEAAIIARVDRKGEVIAGTQRRFEVDAVASGYGFVPSSELTRLIGCLHSKDRRGSAAPVPVTDGEGRTSHSGVYVAGDCAGAWGAGSALAQGELAAAALLADINVPFVPRRTRQARETRFQGNLWRVYKAPLRAPVTPETIICKCEVVRRSDIPNELLRSGDPAALKRATRCGLGSCQGRYCFAALSEIAENVSTRWPSSQTPLKPVRISEMINIPLPGQAKHQPPTISAGTPRPGAAESEVTSCRVLIIGGGIVGICAAHELASSGDDVVLVDKARLPGSEASGANAGSLHVQSLAYAFETFETPAARRALLALPIQRDSAHLWRTLSAELDVDLEIALMGGLCIADDVASLDKLKRKVEFERSLGIDVELITGDEARTHCPHLSEGVIGASIAWDEGKINALLAVGTMARLAESKGARLRHSTEVLAIDREASGFRVVTNNGTYLSSALLIAAGAGSSSIARMLGRPLEITSSPLQMAVTEPMPPLTEMLISHVSRRLTVKQAKSGNVIVGGGWRAAMDGTGRVRPTLDGLGSNLRTGMDALPILRDAHIIRSWVAVNGVPAGGPLIGWMPGMTDCLVAITLNGLTLGPAFGRICADLLRGKAPAWNIEPFDPAAR